MIEDNVYLVWAFFVLLVILVLWVNAPLEMGGVN